MVHDPFNKVPKWAVQNVFKLNTQKSTCVRFSNEGGVLPDTSIISVVNSYLSSEHKFLGIKEFLDSKLTFIPHLKHLKAKCVKAMNLQMVLACITRGSDRKCFLSLHTSLIGSCLDCCSTPICHTQCPKIVRPCSQSWYPPCNCCLQN